MGREARQKRALFGSLFAAIFLPGHFFEHIFGLGSLLSCRLVLLLSRLVLSQQQLPSIESEEEEATAAADIATDTDTKDKDEISQRTIRRRRRR